MKVLQNRGQLAIFESTTISARNDQLPRIDEWSVTLPKIIFPRLPGNATSYGSFEVKLAKLSEVPLALLVKGC